MGEFFTPEDEDRVNRRIQADAASFFAIDLFAHAQAQRLPMEGVSIVLCRVAGLVNLIATTGPAEIASALEASKQEALEQIRQQAPQFLPLLVLFLGYAENQFHS